MIKELQKKLLGKDTYNEQMIEALERYIREQQKEIEDLKKEMFDLQCDYIIVVGKHNELEDRIDKALEIVDNINKQYEKISDKDLLTNRVVDISVIQEIENRLKGEK